MSEAIAIMGRLRSIRADVTTYVSCNQIAVSLRDFEITKGSILSSVQGYGNTFEEALISLWKKIASLPVDQYLVGYAMKDDRTAIRWDGFSWVTIQEPV